MNSQFVHLWRAYTHRVTSIATTAVDVAPMAIPIPIPEGRNGNVSEFDTSITEIESLSPVIVQDVSGQDDVFVLLFVSDLENKCVH